MNVKKYALLGGGTLVLALLVFLGPLRFIDNLFYDLNFAFAPSAASDSVVIVGVDSKSIADRGGWPWSRSAIARLVEQISSSAPRAVAMDFLFPYREGAAENDSLARVFSRTTNLVIPFRAAGITLNGDRNVTLVPTEVFRQKFQIHENSALLDNHQFYSGTQFNASDSLFAVHAKYGGFLNVSTSNTSQKLREIIHVIRSGNEYFPSFGLAAVAAYYGLRPTEFVLDGKGPSVKLGKRALPLTRYAATSFLNYRSQNNPIRSVSASDVIDGAFDRSLLSGKLVFVGITDPAAGASDFFLTPLRPQFPGVEAWATSALDIIDDTWIRRDSGSTLVAGAFNWLLLLILFPGLALLVPNRFKLFSLVGGLIAVAGSIALSIVLFRTSHLFWNPANHLYAWFFGLLWLAAQKADPTLAEVPRLEIEPAAEDETDLMSAPAPSDFLSLVPQTATGVHVLNLITEQTGRSAKITFAGETSNGTMVEALPEYLPQQARDAVLSVDSPVSSESMESFRQMAGGQIVKLLGSGGMADVYLVWNPRLELYRAIKVLKPGQSSANNTRFETEIRIFAKLNHCNIVQCYTVGEWHGLPYVEMEYINGTSLESMGERSGPLDPIAVMGIGALVCRALAYAHGQVVTIYGKTYRGVIHRDIKPANIMISRSGRIKLTDFGIARPSEVSIHTMDSGNVVGTLPYLAPEQLDGAELSNKADLYALGATLYELLSAKRAFPQTDVSALVKAKAMGTYEPLAGSERMPKQLVEIINRAMSTSAADRFESALVMGEQLEHCMRSSIKGQGYPYLRSLADRYWL